MSIEVEKDLKAIFKESSLNVQYSLFFQSNEYHNYQCLQSNMKNYQTDLTYPIYELAPLVRLLGNHRGLLSDDLKEEFYQDEDQQLAILVEWTEHSRKVFIFKEADNKYLELAKCYQKNKSSFLQYYRSAYYQTKEGQ